MHNMHRMWWPSGLSHKVSNSSRDNYLGPMFKSRWGLWYRSLEMINNLMLFKYQGAWWLGSRWLASNELPPPPSTHTQKQIRQIKILPLMNHSVTGKALLLLKICEKTYTTFKLVLHVPGNTKLSLKGSRQGVKVFWPAFSCAQHLKAGRNSQRWINIGTFWADIGSEIIPDRFGLIICTFLTSNKDFKIIQGWLRIEMKCSIFQINILKNHNFWTYRPIS